MDVLIDLFLHLDTHLEQLTATYGVWIYALLFAIVFAETGFVVTPFLPGDSLLFAVGALSATPGRALDLRIAAPLLFCAAILGNTINYSIGSYVGPRVFVGGATDSLLSRLLNRKHLARAHTFFERYGGKAVVLGQFVPIVRTFVPFVAGAGAMRYSSFIFYNIVGAAAWVGICSGAGYAFGNIPIVRNNFSLVVVGIVFVSLLPALIEILRHRRSAAGGGAPSI